MRKLLLIWGLPVVIYAGFWAWYTNLGGPISPAEAETYLAYFETRDVDAVRLAQLQRFMAEDDGGDFVMLNLLDLKSEAAGADLAAGATGEDAMARYMDYMWPSLLARASHPLLFGPAISDAMDIEGMEGAVGWTSGAAMRYRSRRDMMEIATNPAFSGAHVYKMAALDKTIAVPVHDGLPLADPRVLLFFVLMSLAGLLNAFVRR